MPCTVTGSLEGDARLSASQAWTEATKTTQLLCALCKKWEKKGIPVSEMPRDVARWWKKHKKIDEDRKKREDDEKRKRKIKKKALSKLTKEERESLDI